MTAIAIRSATETDANSLHRIHTAAVREVCAGSYAELQVEAWLQKRSPGGYQPAIEAEQMFVAELGKEVIGFGHSVPGEVLAIFVEPTHHRRGVGALLLSEALERSGSPAELEATLNAVPFYERHGFVAQGQLVVQRNGVDILVERMRLESPSHQQ